MSEFRILNETIAAYEIEPKEKTEPRFDFGWCEISCDRKE
jgi:hypothetical protein